MNALIDYDEDISPNWMLRNDSNSKNYGCFFSGTWDLDNDSLLILKNMRKHFKELADAHMLKEGLRSIYATAGNALEARADSGAGQPWQVLPEAGN